LAREDRGLRRAGEIRKKRSVKKTQRNRNRPTSRAKQKKRNQLEKKVRRNSGDRTQERSSTSGDPIPHEKRGGAKRKRRTNNTVVNSGKKVEPCGRAEFTRRAAEGTGKTIYKTRVVKENLSLSPFTIQNSKGKKNRGGGGRRPVPRP